MTEVLIDKHFNDDISVRYNMGPVVLTWWLNFFCQLKYKDYIAAANNMSGTKLCG